MRVKIDLTHPSGAVRLCDEMASAISRCWEGLVVKDCNAQYLSLHGDVRQIKMKKDYIPGLGDSADLVIVGGGRDAKEVWAQGIRGILWTISCIHARKMEEGFLQLSNKLMSGLSQGSKKEV